MEKKYSFEEFVGIIETLRGENGCPWDREQTHESLKNCMIEEAYEVVDGIDQCTRLGSYESLCEELGDVLLQVVMHSVIAKEEEKFSMEDVIHGVANKMVYRHPHVFGTAKLESSEEVLMNWEELKKKEKKENSIAEGMKKVPRAMPATMRAEKIQKKAAKVGFDFENYEQALSKVYEELKELELARSSEGQCRIDEEFGDLVFSVVNLSRFLKLNVENSLTNATDKFINRFEDVENLAVSEGQHLKEMSIDELNALWGRIK